MSNNNNRKKGRCYFGGRTLADYSNGYPPRDSSNTNSSVSNVSTVNCSLTTSSLNANSIVSNDQGSSLWTAKISDVIIGLDPTQLQFTDARMLNRGLYPYEFIPNFETGTFQVTEGGIYNITLSIDIEFDTMPEGILELVETEFPLVSLMYVLSLTNGFFMCSTISGMVRLKANTDYQFNIHFQTPSSAHNTVYESFFIERIY